MERFPLNEKYMVTTSGDVYSLRSGKPYKLKYQRDISGNYYRVAIGDDHYLVHRIVAITYLPNPDNLPQVNHKDGNKLNNCVENLEWVTVGDNQRHAYQAGLKKRPKGLLNGRQELEEDEVLYIYTELLKGTSVTSLADKFNVSTTQIIRIKKKEHWSHITAHFPDISIKDKRQPLTEDQVIQVCEAINNGISFPEFIKNIAFDLSRYQFYDIKRGKCFPTISKKYLTNFRD